MNLQTPIDRTARPAATEATHVEFPEYTTFTLENGLRVYHVHDPRPMVTARLLVPGGSSADGHTLGVAEMLAELLTKGAGDLDASEFADAIDFLGGNISASASVDHLSLSARGLRTRFELVLELFAMVLLDPAFDEEELEKMKGIAIEGLIASKSEPSYIASRAVARLVYGDSPLGKMPSEETIRDIDRDSVEEYFDTFVSPAASTLAVVGDYDTDELRVLLEKHLGGWQGEAETGVPDHRFAPEGGRVILVDRPTSVQSAIRIVGPGPFPNDSEYAATRILGDIYGGGTGLGNRLTMNLRETHGWTYSPRAGFPANRYVGTFSAHADVAGEVTADAVAEMLKEIDLLRREDVPDEELALNVHSAVGRYLMSLANPDLTARRVQQLDFYDMSPDYYDALVESYRSTSQSEIRDLANRLFERSRLSIIVVGKAADIGDSLDRFGDVELWNTDLEPIRQVGPEEIGMSAAEIWRKMLDAMGGEERLRSIRSLQLDAAVALTMQGQQIPGAYRELVLHPDRRMTRISAEAAGQQVGILTSVVAPDGVELFGPMDQPLESTPENDSALRESAHIMVEAWAESLGGHLVVDGVREVDGQRVYQLVLTLPGETVVRYDIDGASFLPLQREVGGTAIAFDRWGEIGEGVIYPIAFEITTGELSARVSEARYVLNEEISEEDLAPEGGGG